jgi:alpha-tubulin suppressor-like RCC1 family protein
MCPQLQHPISMHEPLSGKLRQPAITRVLLVALCALLANCGGEASVTQPFAQDTPQDAGHRIVSIVSAGRPTCALTDAGTVFCWGPNYLGEFGNGTKQPSNVPVSGATGLRLSKIFGSVSAARMCGLDAQAQAFCWGANFAETDAVVTPALVPGGLRFTAIASPFGTCALDDAGQAYCWGVGFGGATTPQLVAGPAQYTAITSGTNFTCALQGSGAVYCWGVGVALGSEVTSSPTPIPVSGGLRFAHISAGDAWVCALTLAGAPYCWGSAGKSGLTDDVRPTPEPVPTNLTFREIIAVNGYGACALTQAGEAYCWYGRGTPQPVPGHHQFAGLGSGLSPVGSGSSAAYCAYTAGGAGYCWYWGTALYNGQPVPELTIPEQLPPMP